MPYELPGGGRKTEPCIVCGSVANILARDSAPSTAVDQSRRTSPPRVKGKRPLPNLHRSSSLAQMELVEFHGLVFFFKKKNGVSRTKPPPTSATKICAPRERPD